MLQLGSSEHVMRAVSTDNRMRAWCADDSLEDGLLFKCYLGRVDLEAPVGESSHTLQGSWALGQTLPS